MPHVPAVDRFRRLVDDISRLYVDARRAQVRFAWATGRLIVIEEQNGEVRAEYGKELIPKLSKELAEQYGPGFSVSNLKKMRQFYSFHQKRSASFRRASGDTYVITNKVNKGHVVDKALTKIGYKRNRS